MKKLILCLFVLTALLFDASTLGAGEYLTYEEITFHGRNQKLLRNFNEFDYNRLYSQLGRRRFFGWRTTTNMSNVPVSFKKETLYVIVNEGETPIRQNFTFRQSEQTSRQISSSGSIGLDLSGDIRAFEAGLESSLNFSFETKRSTMIEEAVDIHIQVDPWTRLEVEIYGEGMITNGVGRRYKFFRNTKSGGWEIFTLQSEHYSIVKSEIER